MDDELAEVTVPQIWAGVDIGKEHHHCVVIDAEGERLLSRRVLNDEAALLELISDVLALADDVLWAVDINHGGAALLIGLLLCHDQPMVYLTGLAVHQASAAYRGQGKTQDREVWLLSHASRLAEVGWAGVRLLVEQVSTKTVFCEGASVPDSGMRLRPWAGGPAFAAGHLGELTQVITPSLVDTVLIATGRVQVRVSVSCRPA
ncbi:transposase [Streptomyces sp. NPDC005533]|uniref:IS110 family transposase n=1 Tax=Streptomyces sp. NPDC005533 TaxID=3364723 RepID=UPI0036B77F3E